ncbi:GlmL-related ornithine degradation protein [Romboutsia sp. 1001216sp1]|uniref:GlmL-related ornithine degradation protein n=1 Tax=Romboutsia TaxID=1501226 RepID=UPI000B0D74BA|nr:MULTISPECIES: GlmL-related ornithine degradation protein [Romboutsia]MDB8790904.1 GlmL-related ornithine degradation protein [Romboutsia sp. 1001216sp1]MDB8792438.1 GlmL-related ornithine degradation protein [Romboutsia sp. 1001216sp1]MDB8795733.1 GlmL-related ornithine degradation protein [Romboutsia sp. 1001216sp1]MDB8798388.1 GlmL-related ornithine degradation protein [Romboutsia sp. 1001216sp1]MDB8800898.1 GlmL-related ornithine degradation protein [Romboutsia sp. 1001216sp1]
MKVDVLVAEIGSTTTVVNAFFGIHTDSPKFIGQGQAPTTVFEGGDVRNGLNGAIDDLAKKLGVDSIEYNDFFATSSAAGGLKMTVHGLVYDMTAKAAKEAALGAGAVIHKVTAGKLRRTDLKEIKEISPNIILIAGGVDYGERDTAIYNAELIAGLNLGIPVIYAGNIENIEEIKLIFEDTNYKLYIVDNVYPKIDYLNIEPTRCVIQNVFEEHITNAPGMEHIKELVNSHITPTPGAVMEASKLLRKNIGDLMVIDVGGATTDIHSVTEGNDGISRILVNPEPIAKRSVEGDLGVYVNMRNIVNTIGKENLQEELSDINLDEVIENYLPIPKTKEQIILVERLTKEAALRATKRHSGIIRSIYSTSGKSRIAEGKDLTEVRYIVGTGGALTRLPNRVKIMKEIPKNNKNKDLLFPKETVKVLVDNDYIMASLGVLSKKYEDAALKLMLKSLNFKEETLCIQD